MEPLRRAPHAHRRPSAARRDRAAMRGPCRCLLRGLLRAWERRYGLLRPTRSAGGLRLYSAADVERVRLMNQHLAEGLAAAEAAALAQSADDEHGASAALSPAAMRDELAEALDRFDEPRAQAIVDRLLAAATVDTLLSDVVLPYLRELGERWERGEASIAQEHFASAVLRGRLLGLARGWGLGVGPLAVLACLPGEQHDLGLIAFALVLRARGWRIVYLGAGRPDRHRRGCLPPAAAEPRRPARGHRRARPARRRVPSCACRPPPSRARRRRRRERRPGARPRAIAHRRPDRRGHAGHDTRPGRTVRTTALGDRIVGRARAGSCGDHPGSSTNCGTDRPLVPSNRLPHDGTPTNTAATAMNTDPAAGPDDRAITWSLRVRRVVRRRGAVRGDAPLVRGR